MGLQLAIPRFIFLESPFLPPFQKKYEHFRWKKSAIIGFIYKIGWLFRGRFICYSLILRQIQFWKAKKKKSKLITSSANNLVFSRTRHWSERCNILRLRCHSNGSSSVMVVFRLTLRLPVLLHQVMFICCRPSCRQPSDVLPADQNFGAYYCLIYKVSWHFLDGLFALA